jgi:hypothetical protein
MQTINANSEKTITIYVELIKLPTASEGLTSASFNIELTAVTAE